MTFHAFCQRDSTMSCVTKSRNSTSLGKVRLFVTQDMKSQKLQLLVRPRSEVKVKVKVHVFRRHGDSTVPCVTQIASFAAGRKAHKKCHT